MPDNKCNRCGDFILWIEMSAGWRPFDYGKQDATPENPLVSKDGEVITQGKGFVSHFETCAKRLRKKQIQARKSLQERQERRKKARVTKP